MAAALPIMLQDEHRSGSKYFPRYLTRLFAGNGCSGDIRTVSPDELAQTQGFYTLSLGSCYRLSRAAADKKGGGILVYDAVDRQVWEQAARHGSKLLLDMMIEVIFPTPEIVDALLDGCAEFGIDPSNIVIMNSNRRASAAMNRLLDDRNVTFRPTFHDTNACYWLIKGHNVLTPDNEGQLLARQAAAEAARSGVRDRKFVSFNGRLRRHRLFVITWLMAKGYLEQGFVSLLGYSAGDAPTADQLRASILRYRDHATVSPLIPEFLDRLPMKIDVALEESQHKGAYIQVLPWISPQAEPYDQSYFSIILDTSFDDGDMLFLTPIAYKSFMNFSPFVYFGNQGALAEMRRLGFQTFWPFIDESYDDIADNDARLRAGLAELDRLVSMSKSELADIHEALWERLVHNFWHLHRPDVAGFHADITDPLQQALRG